MPVDPWGAPIDETGGGGYLPRASFNAEMDRVYGKGNWRETGGWRSQARENQLRAQGAATVRAGQVSAHSVGTYDAPGAFDIQVSGMGPQAAAARLRQAGSYLAGNLYPEGGAGTQGPHLHIGVQRGVVDPWGAPIDEGEGAAPAKKLPGLGAPPEPWGKPVDEGEGRAPSSLPTWMKVAALAAGPAGLGVLGADTAPGRSIMGGLALGGAKITEGLGGLADYLIKAQTQQDVALGLDVGGEKQALAKGLEPIGAEAAAPVTGALRRANVDISPIKRGPLSSLLHGAAETALPLAGWAVDPALGGAAFGAQGYGENYQAARDAGQTPEQAERAGIMGFGVEAGLGMLPFGKPFDAAIEATGGVGAGAVAPRIIAAAGGAGLQMGAIQAGENVVAQNTYDPNRPIFAQVPEAIEQGSIAGAAIHGAHETFGAFLRPSDDPSVGPHTENNEPPPPPGAPPGPPVGPDGMPEPMALAQYYAGQNRPGAPPPAPAPGGITLGPEFDTEPPAPPAPPAPPPATPTYEEARLAAGAPTEYMPAAISDVSELRGAADRKTDIFTAMRQLGGVRTRDRDGKIYQVGPDIDAALHETRKGRSRQVKLPGLVNNKSGLSPELMAQALADRGWFGVNAADPSLAFEQAVNSHTPQTPYYHPQSETADQIARREALTEEQARAGVQPTDSLPVAAAKLAKHRFDISRESGPEMDALLARATDLGVEPRAGADYDEILGDVLERESIRDELPLGIDADQDEREIDTDLTPEEERWVFAPERGPRGQQGPAGEAEGTGQAALDRPEAEGAAGAPGAGAGGGRGEAAPVSAGDELSRDRQIYEHGLRLKAAKALHQGELLNDLENTGRAEAPHVSGGKITAEALPNGKYRVTSDTQHGHTEAEFDTPAAAVRLMDDWSVRPAYTREELVARMRDTAGEYRAHADALEKEKKPDRSRIERLRLDADSLERHADKDEKATGPLPPDPWGAPVDETQHAPEPLFGPETLDRVRESNKLIHQARTEAVKKFDIKKHPHAPSLWPPTAREWYKERLAELRRERAGEGVTADQRTPAERAELEQRKAAGDAAKKVVSDSVIDRLKKHKRAEETSRFGGKLVARVQDDGKVRVDDESEGKHLERIFKTPEEAARYMADTAKPRGAAPGGVGAPEPSRETKTPAEYNVLQAEKDKWAAQFDFITTFPPEVDRAGRPKATDLEDVRALHAETEISALQDLGQQRTIEDHLAHDLDPETGQKIATPKRRDALRKEARDADEALNETLDTYEDHFGAAARKAFERRIRDVQKAGPEFTPPAEPPPSVTSGAGPRQEQADEAAAKNPPSDYGKKNTVFTEEAANAARERLKKLLNPNQLNAGIDPELIHAGLTLAGYHVEAGARRFADFAKAMLEDIGEEARPFLRMWYNAVRDYPGFTNTGMTPVAEVTDEAIAHVRGSRTDLEPGGPAAAPGERNGPAPLSPGPGGAQRGPGAPGGGAAGGGRGAGGGQRLPDRGPADGGEPGAQQLHGAEPGAPGGVPGGNQPVGGDGPGDPRVQPDTVPADHLEQLTDEAAHVEPVADGAHPDASSINAPPVSAEVEQAVPTLFPEQRSDVQFALDRFEEPDGHGVLFTNGTGTGKTFTGGGIAKLFYDRGKKNILVIAPSQGVLDAWKGAMAKLGVPFRLLESTQENGGEGPVGTTYANLAANRHLADREWDLIIPDESHNLSSDKDGSVTQNLQTLRAITNHPDGLWTKGEHQLRAEVDRVESMKPPKRVQSGPAYEAWTNARRALDDRIKAKVEGFKELARSKVAFLSATPFAYDKNVEYAQGYLFDWGKPTGNAGRYNAGDAKDQFFIRHFGYRMRFNKLTKPEHAVDSEVMERQFHEYLKAQKKLSGRMLTVDKDYDRKFMLVDDGVGNKIDQALDFLHNAEEGRYRPLANAIEKQFDYLRRARLLEAIKAKHAIPAIAQHMKLGRKVVVFHQYNEGGGFSPFVYDEDMERHAEIGKDGRIVRIKTLHDDFLAQNPYVEAINEGFQNLRSPIEQLREAFPQEVAFYNGTIPRGVRAKAIEKFNTDGPQGGKLIVVQADAGSVGISLHDTTGKHQRVVLNLGLPVRPTTAIQQEGRIYRVGQASNAIFRYMNTGTNWERRGFATVVAERSGTAENLGMGDQARTLRQSFIDAFVDSAPNPPARGEGVGGKAKDRDTAKALSEFQKAKSYYFAQRKQTGRRDQREGVDYFPTPEPLGLKMTEWADVRNGEHILEPSAGHGAIARFFPETTERTLIEPSADLASRAALASPGARVLEHRFEDLHAVNKYHAIVMNPPFGAGGATAIAHLERAVNHLRDGGRIVALLPEGPAADKRLEAFLDSPAAKNIYRAATIRLPEATFERAGTKIRAHVVVLERHDTTESAPQAVHRDFSDAKTINEFFDRIEHTTVPERSKVSTIDQRNAEAQAARGERVEAPRPAAATAAAAPAASVDFTKAETIHGKTGKPLFVATAATRMSSEGYQATNKLAKKHGGYYSAFRGRGAVPGFQFDSAEARDKFVREARGEPQEAPGAPPPPPPTTPVAQAAPEQPYTPKKGDLVHWTTRQGVARQGIVEGEYDQGHTVRQPTGHGTYHMPGELKPGPHPEPHKVMVQHPPEETEQAGGSIRSTRFPNDTPLIERASERERLAGQDVEQQIIPGSERSAQQAAQARGETLKPNVPQRRPGGLFDEPDTTGEMFPGDRQKQRLTRRDLLRGAAAAGAGAAARPARAELPEDFHTIVKNGAPVDAAARWLAANSKNPLYRLIAGKLAKGGFGGAKIYTADLSDPHDPYRQFVEDGGEQTAYGATISGPAGERASIVLARNSAADPAKSGMNEETLLHEMIHTWIKARYDELNHYLPGNRRLLKQPDRAADAPIAKLHDVLESARDVVNKIFPDPDNMPTWADEFAHSPDEGVAWALTNPEAQAFLKSYDLEGNKVEPKDPNSIWEKFVTWIRKMFGIPDKDHTAFGQILEASNAVFDAGTLDRPDYAYSKALVAEAQREGVYTGGPHLQRLADEEETRTPAFRRWFGRSKVTDEGGKPIVVYHGTGVHPSAMGDNARPLGDIEEFDRSAAQRAFGRAEGIDQVGSWFSESPQDHTGERPGAGMYAPREGGALYPAFLKVENPWRPATFDAFLDKMHEAAGRNPKEQRPRGRGSVGPLRDWLKARGFDGIYFGPGVIDHKNAAATWVALEPTQIKSTLNRGTFDAADRRIAFQRTRREDDQTPDLFAAMEPTVQRPAKGRFSEPAPDPEKAHFDQNHADLARLGEASLRSTATPAQIRAEAQRLAQEMGRYMDWADVPMPPVEKAGLERGEAPTPERMVTVARRYTKDFAENGEHVLYDHGAYHDVMRRWYEAGGGERPKFARAAPFYSALERNVERGPSQATPEQWIATIKNAPGIKREEVEWSGVEDYLKSFGKASVPKELVRQFVQDHGVHVEEIVLGEPADPEAVERLAQERLQEEVDHRVNSGKYDDVQGYHPHEDNDGWTVRFDGQDIDAPRYDSEEEAQEAADDRNREAMDDMLQDFRNEFHDKYVEEAEAELTSRAGTQYEGWVLPGDQGYRELLLTLPQVATPPHTHWNDRGVMAHVRFNDREMPDGKRALFIEEVQSDWHQKGRDAGYAQPATLEEIKRLRDAHLVAMNALDVVNKRVIAAADAVADEVGEKRQRRPWVAGYHPQIPDSSTRWAGKSTVAHEWFGRLLMNEEHLFTGEDFRQGKRHPPSFAVMREALRDRQDASLRESEARQAANNAARGVGIADAPFKTAWPALIMKRMIVWAVEHGYDHVAWTRGDQQADRYKLSGVTGEIRAGLAEDGRYVIEMNQAAAEALARQDVGEMAYRYASGRNELFMTPDQMKQAFGAEITDRIVKGVAEPHPGRKFRLEGEDLTVGGHGMRAFYDRNLVNITNDIIKKYGAKVGKVDFREPETGDLFAQKPFGVGNRPDELGEQHGFAITDKMREAATEGLPLFAFGKRGAEPEAPAEAPRRMTGPGSPTEGMVRLTEGLRGEPYSPLWDAHAQALVKIVGDEIARIAPQAVVTPMKRMVAHGPDAGPRGYDTVGAQFSKRIGGKLRQVVAWALDAPDAVRAGRHEALHAIWHLFSQAEQAMLEKAALDRDWMGRYNIKKRYPDVNRRGQLEEAIADRFSDWRQGSADRLPLPAMVKTAFGKLEMLLRGVAAKTRALLGQVNADDLMTMAERGEIGRRERAPDAGPQLGQLRFSRESDEEGKRAPREVSQGGKRTVDRLLGTGPDRMGGWLQRSVGKFLKTDAGDVGQAVRMALNPMAAGGETEQASAKDFANAMRAIDHDHDKLDAWIVSKFTPAQREKMALALDREGVAIRQGKRAGAAGLDGLTPEERDAVMRLNRLQEADYRWAKDVGIHDNEGLEYHFPRMAAGKDGARVKRANQKQIEAGGRLTVTTGQMRQRKYETIEDTEAAVKAAFGEDAHVIRDIRAVALASRNLEKAIAGKVLVNKIEQTGKEVGQEAVSEDPAKASDPEWFRMPDQPAMTKWGPRMQGGKPLRDEHGEMIWDSTPLYIRKTWEGPLRAVLYKPDPFVWRALMALKSKIVGLIMYNPLVHNQVIYGKAFPTMVRHTGIGAVSFKLYRDGGQVRKDAVLMRRAIGAGLVPINQRYSRVDAGAIDRAEPMDPQSGWTSSLLGFIAGRFNKGFEAPTKAAMDAVHDFISNQMLWNRIADLQAGIWKTTSDHYVEKQGYDRESADRIAAYFANMYAGSVPREATSNLARGVLNAFLFSRSFHQTNVSGIKAIIAGLPTDVQAQIKRDAGARRLAEAQGATRAQAMSTVLIDIAVANAFRIAAAGAVAFLLHRAIAWPWNNEPGKTNKVEVGEEPNKAKIYVNIPFGKYADELTEWFSEPMAYAHQIMFGPTRLAMQYWANDMGYGRKAYDPYDKSLLGLGANTLRALGNLAETVVPMGTVSGLMNVASAPTEADRRSAEMQLAGALTGFTISHGAPGGPAMGEAYQIRDRVRMRLADHRDEIVRLVKAGQSLKAAQLMHSLGADQSLIRSTIHAVQDPRARFGRQLRGDVKAGATPQELENIRREMAQ